MTCKDCVHYDLCRSCSRIQLGWHGNSVHYVENIEEICKDFKDRSRFVELPCDIISKAEIKRELNAQCAVKKIDVETAKDMLKNLPYIRLNTKQELKERETIPNNITPEATIIELNRCKVNGYMPIDWGRRGRAIERANAALRKQIPQKLIVTTSTKRCPSCNKQLTNKGCIHSKYNYCKWCGQALDWDGGESE